MLSASHTTSLLLALMAMPLAQLTAAEKVLGAYIYARHGDRTAKVLKNTQLTSLGYEEEFLDGAYYRNRYISSSSAAHIVGINDNLVDLKQVSASSPTDNVIQNSGTAFLQGLYPPAGSQATQQTLANGTSIAAPLNGYQLIPLQIINSGSGSENTPWLQSADKCQKAAVASNNFYTSSLYNSLLGSTRSFYHSLSPLINSTFSESEMDFKQAFEIWDYLNVAQIHNASFPAENMLTPEIDQKLLVLANTQQYALAWNESDPIIAIAGSLLAGDVLTALNQTITTQGEYKLGVQFGSYGTFLSYFGLAQLPAVNVDFTGMPTYASSMTWELVTNSTASGFPSADEISVRFFFHNGTITAGEEPTPYPLHGQSSLLIPWSDFVTQANKFAVTSQVQWCSACGNTQGSCAGVNLGTSPGSSNPPSSSPSSSSGGMSLAVAGVIGAMVTLAVILGVEGLLLLFGGFRIAKRSGSSSAGTSYVLNSMKH